MCVYNTRTHTSRQTHQAESDQRNGRSLRGSQNRGDLGLERPEGSRPDHGHLPTWASEREGASPDPGQQAQLGHHGQPPGGASAHPVCVPHSLGSWGLSHKGGENTSPGLVPPARAQFLNTPQKPGRTPKLVRFPGSTTFSLKGKNLSKDFTVGVSAPNRTQSSWFGGWGAVSCTQALCA